MKKIFYENFMQKQIIQLWINSSWLNQSNRYYIESMYNMFLKNPNSIDLSWRKTFSNLSKKSLHYSDNVSSIIAKENNLTRLIENFRFYGYKLAKTDPLNLNLNSKNLNLKLSDHGLTKEDLKNPHLINLFEQKVSKLLNYENFYEKIKKIYCASIGFEYMHIDNLKEKCWIQKQIEIKPYQYLINRKKKINLLKELIASETLEKYLNYKFPGSKRFSLEGSEVLIPMLHEIINYAKNQIIPEIVLGMAHRGRLNVLINVLNKQPRQLFNEFFDTVLDVKNNGDVKYHLGTVSIIQYKHHKTRITLKPNPSHLEIINPVIMGTCRFHIDHNIKDSNKIIPIVIHGDAAVSGQGVIQETLNMSQTRGYTVGGTVHIVINNQIGFTTSNIKDLRSSPYCTDISKMIQSPVLHVNSDDPEAAIFSMILALKYRSLFKKDIFINLVSYRRYGHNEVDDPSVTQPIMYKKIRQHSSVKNIYSEKLISLGIIDVHSIKLIIQKYQDFLDIEYALCNKEKKQCDSEELSKQIIISNQIKKKYFIDSKKLSELAEIIFSLPNTINIHPKIKKIYLERMLMAKGINQFDWGAAELLAYATLVYQGISCRLSGEDISRGTFFHRNAIIYDQLIDHCIYVPLSKINNKKAQFNIWNSILSEEAVLAFEYGYASQARNTLSVWEAQFGDFSNVAQVVIDQFLSTGEQKWNEKCNLTLFLPHGYEGQGPEHSSARLERFLQLCAQNNMQVNIPTTSAQIYHLLRRQALNNVKKPLIILTPKSMLRHPLTFSNLDILSTGNFKKVINEIDEINASLVKKIIFCSGKIFFDLLLERRKKQINTTILIRIEELYPFPYAELLESITPFIFAKYFFWCQEEPINQGAWYYMQSRLQKLLPSGSLLKCISRPASAVSAVGSKKIHDQQQRTIINKAINENNYGNHK